MYITRASHRAPAVHPLCSQVPDNHDDDDDDDDDDDADAYNKIDDVDDDDDNFTCGPLVLSWTGGRGVCPSWAGTRPSNLSNIALQIIIVIMTILHHNDDNENMMMMI